MVSMDFDCDDFVPFTHYDWTFERVGRLKWKYVADHIQKFSTSNTLTMNSPTAYCLIASFCAVAFWMSIELLVLVYVTFKRKSGVYFWSIIITTIGIILQTAGYLIKEFAPGCPIILTTIICKVGWVSNVTGFAIVLWSRLHLVVNEPRILRGILLMIVVNALCFHTPVVVFEFGLISKDHDRYMRPMEIMERVQQTVFTLQEAIISSLYIFYTRRFLNSGSPHHTRKVVRLLVCVQVLVIALDAGLTAFDYKNMFTLKCTIHPAVYALKLKLEFVVLNQLLSIVKRGLAPGLPSALLVSNRDSDSDSNATPNAAAAQAKAYKVPSSFITKPDLVRQSTLGSNQSSEQEKTPVQSVVVASAAALAIANEEHDLIDVVGQPDEPLEPTVTDVERQYLGRYQE